jgi:PAS domain S-box-containing protein
VHPQFYQVGRVVPMGSTSETKKQTPSEIKEHHGQLRVEQAARLALERALRESEERYRHLVEVCPDAILIHRNERFIFVNPAGRRMFGAAALSDLVGRSIHDVIHPDYRPMVRRRVRAVMLHRRRAEIVYQQLLRLDGSVFDAEAVSTCVEHEGLPAVQTILRDVSEEHDARRELQSQLMHAQKMEALGNMAGSVAHDFNNLMAAILGHTEMLLIPNPGDERPPLREDVASILELIQEVCRKATSMTGDLMQFSRKRVVTREIIDVDEIIGTLKPMLDRLVGRQIEIRSFLSASGPKLQANAGQVEQVIMNLVINARDALPPERGWIEIETQAVELDQVHVRRHVGSRPGPHVRIVVRDNGHGMDEETQRHVFEPFFTTKPSGVGTGLGLSTVYGIVRDAGGHITLTSTPGEGTTFSIYWPAITAEPPSPSN